MASEGWTPIYTIVLFRTTEEVTYKITNGNGKIIKQESDFVTLGDWDVVGFLHNKEDALEAVEANAGDMYETCFDYAIVEEVYPGIYGRYTMENERWFFEFNRETGRYVQIDMPEILNEKNYPWWKLMGFKKIEE